MSCLAGLCRWVRIAFVLLFSVCVARAEIDPDGADAPPEIVARAKQLVEQKDYLAVEAMIAEVDAQNGKDHGRAYFRALLGIRSAVVGWPRYPAKPDYSRIWLANKILWKVYLTPYSRIEDAALVQEMKNLLGGFNAPPPLGDFDRDQFVALRNDGIARLEAYRDLLAAHTVPGYIRKPIEPHRTGFFSEEEAIQRASPEGRKLAALLTQNELENAEQDELNASLHRLKHFAEVAIEDSFCWAPQDEAAVNRLLGKFFGSDKERARIFSELQSRRETERVKKAL
ncbi:hypothetical protein [Chthoniobacter flavus]|nr:hypothetical protein [Chthoniobacter flavus]